MAQNRSGGVVEEVKGVQSVVGLVMRPGGRKRWHVKLPCRCTAEFAVAIEAKRGHRARSGSIRRRLYGRTRKRMVGRACS